MIISSQSADRERKGLEKRREDSHRTGEERRRSAAQKCEICDKIALTTAWTKCVFVVCSRERAPGCSSTTINHRAPGASEVRDRPLVLGMRLLKCGAVPAAPEHLGRGSLSHGGRPSAQTGFPFVLATGPRPAASLKAKT